MSAAPGRRLIATPPAAGQRLGRRVEGLPVFGIVSGLGIALVAVLVAYPLARLLADVFLSGGSPLDNIRATLADPALPPALGNTVLLIVAAGPCAIVIGAVFAWLNERSDARMGWSADVLPIIPLLVPSIATTIGWVFLLAPRAGFLNSAFRRAVMRDAGPLASGPLDIYSAAGMVWVTILVTVPLAYLTVAAALRNMDPALEEASRLSGAGPARTFVHVTLPAARNAVATAAVLVLIGIMSLFTVPVIIGSQGGTDVLAVLIFRSLNAPGGPRFDEMIVLSGFMLVLIQGAVVVDHLVARGGHHARLGGRGGPRTRVRLGAFRPIARTAMVVYVAAATVLPLLALALVSLQGFWSPAIVWEKLSLANYREVFGSSSSLGRAFANSLGLGVGTATVLMVLAAVIAFGSATSRGILARVVNGLTALPASVPHVVTGVAFLIAFGSGRLSLQGTLVLLFLAYLVLSLPQASRTAATALSQVGHELWEGSFMSGASRLRTFALVLLPLMLPGLLAGWVIVFVQTFSETSASVFLSTPVASPVTGPVIVDSFRNSATFPQVAALTLAVTLVQTGTVAVVQLAGRRRTRYLGV